MANLTRDSLQRIPDNINFAAEEEKVVKYWFEEKAFEKCLIQSKGKPKYDSDFLFSI